MQKYRPTIHGKPVQRLLQAKRVAVKIILLEELLWQKAYIMDGFKDGRLDGRCTMTSDQIREWTAAGAVEEQSRHGQRG
jgi:hypothetical protein